MTDVGMDHDFQVLIWGYSILGDVANEVALLAEQRQPNLGLLRLVWWDRTAADLAFSLRSVDGGQYERVPYVWALPAVTELRMRVG